MHTLHYRLLEAFRGSFEGRKYIHRNQSIGNFIASHLYEDLLALNRSHKFVSRVQAESDVVNAANRIHGRKGRRGDGTFGQLIPGEGANTEVGFSVRRGPIATLEIGAESKILAKSMIKQIDRVMSDLESQAATFEKQNPQAIKVGLVGVNWSPVYTSYEGKRKYPADPPPSREAAQAIERVLERVTDAFDELLILSFSATNVRPFPFAWVDEAQLRKEYSAALLRISNEFEARF
jgi:hypothetical protein